MKKSWITLIETLVAVIIFGIWILSIISVIIQNISFMDRIKNQTMATSLAKEWIEIAYNLRDTNLLKSVVWNCAKSEDVQQNPDCNTKFTNDSNFKVSVNLNDYYEITDTDNSRENNVLYFHTWEISEWKNWFWYDYNTNNWTKTYFSRYIHFEALQLNWDWWSTDNEKILKIESHVPYKKWAFEKEVVLESFIWKIN